MEQISQSPPATTTSKPWYERALDKLDPEKLPGSLSNFDNEPEWLKNVARELAQACAPGFQIRNAKHITPNFVGRVLGQQCANLYAIGERFSAVNFTPERIEHAKEMVQALQAKQSDPRVASALQALGLAGEMLLSLSEPMVEEFESRVHAAFREALDQPNYSEAVQFFAGFAQGLAKPGLSAKGLARNTTATLIYMKLFIQREEVKKLHTVPELREFLIRSGIPEGVLGQPKRLEKICERMKLSLAKRGRPSAVDKSDTLRS